MKKKINISKNLLAVLVLLLVVCISSSCEKSEDYELVKYLKKTYGPLIVTQQVDFAFAIASEDGSSLKNFEISASFPGQTGTTADTKCYWSLLDGKTYSKDMLSGIGTNGKVTSGSIIEGIVWEMGKVSGYSSEAVTIRYSYVIPEEARGKSLKFDIKYTTAKGTQYAYTTSSYTVENMDMVTDVVLADPAGNIGKRYFSVSEMKAYTLAEVNAQNKSGFIDFVYRYNSATITTPGNLALKLNSCISAPSQSVYLSSDYVPAGWTKNTTKIETRKWDDMQLKGNTPNNYVTDLDLEDAVLAGNTFGEYDLKKDFGLLMQSSDGKYRAFVYLKSVGTATVTIGVKRLLVK